MRILITGATGFIGTALTHALIQQGHEIHYLTTSEKKLKKAALIELIGKRIKIVNHVELQKLAN